MMCDVLTQAVTQQVCGYSVASAASEVRAPHVIYKDCIQKDPATHDIGCSPQKFYLAPFAKQKRYYAVFLREYLAYLNYESVNDCQCCLFAAYIETIISMSCRIPENHVTQISVDEQRRNIS